LKKNSYDLERFSKDPNGITRSKEDYLMVPFVFYGVIYYFFDLLISVYEGTLFH
jgi:hypothetical protein